MQVVPDDTHEGVDALLKEIWIDKKCTDPPAFYATDNIAKDRYLVADTFAEIRQSRQALGLTTMPLPEIHQDVFHARERVARTLNKGHPDYFGALAALKKIFGRSVISKFFCEVELLRNQSVIFCNPSSHMTFQY